MIRSMMMTPSEAVQHFLDNPFTAIVFALGVYGWWRLVARDSITERLRWHLFIRQPHEGFVSGQTRPRRGISVYSGGVWYTTKGTFVGELVYCPWCLGWWIALAQFGVYLWLPNLVLGLALAHAARTVAGLLAKHG